MRRTLDEMAAAVLAADRAGFDNLVSIRDPTFESRVRLLYTNLTSLRLTGLDFLLEPAERPVRADRQSVLGPDARVHRVVVTTRRTGEDGSAEHRVWLTFVDDGARVKLAGTYDGPAERTEPQPLWWLGPISTAVDGNAVVVAGSGQPAALWAGLAARSATSVRSALPSGVAGGWDGRVSLEIPANEQDFGSVLGESVGQYAGIAAVTRPAGAAADAPLRIVVNPRARRLARADLAGLLRHEMVHLATRSPESPAPLWAEEGIAEWVALGRQAAIDEHPATETLLADVERRGPPAGLPTDEAFTAGAPGLNRAYAEAWLVCRYVAGRYSVAQLGELYAQLDQGRSLDEASRAALGIGADDLIAGWRQYLVRLARTA